MREMGRWLGRSKWIGKDDDGYMDTLSLRKKKKKRPDDVRDQMQ